MAAPVGDSTYSCNRTTLLSSSEPSTLSPAYPGTIHSGPEISSAPAGRPRLGEGDGPSGSSSNAPGNPAPPGGCAIRADAYAGEGQCPAPARTQSGRPGGRRRRPAALRGRVPAPSNPPLSPGDPEMAPAGGIPHLARTRAS